uniref:Uncharacterized protein n=1 Tax=viral metagenome TaxID=1070528 RepID=A0A6C0KNN9_9ZZZZ
MNNHIYEICENFDFGSLKLENPTLLNANIYFSKLNTNPNKNFYIQLPKCKTKQGIIQANTKCFCDLEFNSSDKLIVEFFENLENYFIKEICNNKSLWFYDSANISNDDINDFITPVMRSYKGGKKFLIKANIKQEKINLYDENEKKLTLADYDSNNEIIPLLNINGIRFSKSSFIIDIILVQFMVLYPSDTLENQLLIKINKKKEPTLESSNKEKVDDENSKININFQPVKLVEDEVETKELKDQAEAVTKELKDQAEAVTKELKDQAEAVTKELREAKELKETSSFKYLMNNLESNETLDDDYALEITDLDVITENSEPLELKSHESIYLEIYKKAKQKAKEIRRNAVEAFLEAKNIKLKYNLTNIVNDSSSDEDN